MKNFADLFRSIDLDEDALAAHRPDIIMTLSLLGGATMGALALLHATGQRWPLVALNVSVSLLLTINGMRMQRGLTPALPFGWLACLMTVVILGAATLNGMPGVLWSYPMLFLCYFSMPRRHATVLGVVLVLGLAVVVLPTMGWTMAVRILISQVFLLLMINVVLGVIGQLQRSLIEQATTDPLTGAYNRRHLQTHLSRLPAPPVPGATQADGPGNVLLALDIDRFKQINDVHGHDVGDGVLRRFVEVVSERKRASDLLFRTGGEEFILLLQRISSDDAGRLAEALRARVAEADLLAGGPVTVSIGLSRQAAGQDVRDWLKSADTALYAAKRAGRNRVEVAR